MAPKKKPIVVAEPADATVFTAPSVRLFTDWTPARLRAAEWSAEYGDLYQAVTVCEWLLSDDRITSLLETRINTLLGLEPSFEAGTVGNGRRKTQAVKALEAGDDWWESYPESELKQMLRWGLLLGFSVHRHTWTQRPDHGNRLLPLPQFWHPQYVRWNRDKQQWTARDAHHAEHVITPGDGEWIMHAPFGTQRPWAYGLWRSLARWALLKHLAVSDWSRHSEKGSVMVALAPDGAKKEARRELASDLRDMGSDAVVALPAGFKLELLEVKADTKKIYQAQIEMADMAFAIRIRGGNLTTQVDDGSRAAAETQAEAGDQNNLKFDALTLGTTIHQQSLTPWALYNFGDGRYAPWPSWPVEPEEDKTERATMVKTLGEGLTIMRAVGFKIDPEGVKEEFGLTFLGEYKEPEPVVVEEPGKDVANDNADDKDDPKPAKDDA